MGIGGLVITKESIEEFGPVPEAGDVIELDGEDYAVLGVRGVYKVELGRWEVVVKMNQLRDPEVHGEDPPQWVTDAVHPDE